MFMYVSLLKAKFSNTFISLKQITDLKDKLAALVKVNCVLVSQRSNIRYSFASLAVVCITIVRHRVIKDIKGIKDPLIAIKLFNLI